MSMKNSNDTIGNQIRGLPACSAVPQPTAPPRAPLGRSVVLNFRQKMKFLSFLPCSHWTSLQSSLAFKRFFLQWRCDPTRAMASSFLKFLDHTQRHTTAGRTPLDEWSARRRDLYLTTHNTHNRQTSMPPVGFEPTISVGERPQTYALDRAATWTGLLAGVRFQNPHEK